MTDTDYWENDLLGRKEDAQLLHTFLVRRMEERKKLGQTGSYVLNLDAGWGQGKTFFLTGFKELLESEGHKVVLVNAWEDDYAEDPLLAVVSGIKSAFPTGKGKSVAKTVAKLGAQLTVVTAKNIGKSLLKTVAGSEGAAQIIDAGGALAEGGVAAAGEVLEASTKEAGEALLARFDGGKKTVAEFRSKLSALVETSIEKPPLFILIDEVDRCRPNYAISLLERIKHLFEVDGVVFVVATDTEQLRHSIGAVYGSEFDGKGYLLRFFDRTYKFAEAKRVAYISKLFIESGINGELLASPSDDDHINFFNGMAEFYNLSLRELDRCFDILRSVATMWPPRPYRIQLIYLLPLVIAYCRDDRLVFKALANFDLAVGDLNRLKQKDIDVDFRKGDRFGNSFGSEKRSLIDTLLQFQKLAKLTAGKLMDQGNARELPAKWVFFQLQDEFMRSPNRKFSSAHEYGDLVRRVARLTDDGR